jgi:hypothetical protein
MYEKIKALVQENKLSFFGSHTTNVMHFFLNDKDRFLENAKHETNGFGLRSDENLVFSDIYCFDCGAYLDYYLEGDTLIPDHKECFSDNEVVLDIPVPTGELVFSDYPEHGRKVMMQAENKKTDINCTQGVVQRIEEYASAGIAHFYVGNSSPHIYKKGNQLLIGRGCYDEEENEIPLEVDAIDVGYVCTDLWWVTAFDRSIYEKMAQNIFGVEKGSQMTREAVKKADAVLQVEPGTYRLRYFTKVKDERELYATLELISENDKKDDK